MAFWNRRTEPAVTTIEAAAPGMSEGERDFLLERITQLELQQEYIGEGWQLISGEDGQELSRDYLKRVTSLARIMWLKNPLIRHAVEVQTHYVLGQGFSKEATLPKVDAVIQAFWDDPGNRQAVTGEQAMQQLERELQLSGNLFFVLFPNVSDGRVQARTLPEHQVDDIICNPEDHSQPWFYRRTWTDRRYNLERGDWESGQRTVYYPDYRYRPQARRLSIGDKPVLWDSPVYHMRAGHLHGMRFGVSEVLAAIDWAKAVKEDLEDFATLRRAHARFAWSLVTKGGRGAVSAIKQRLNTTLGRDSTETNPVAPAGVAIMGEGQTLSPVRTAGAAPQPEDARRLWLMVAAATGLPETILSGNAEIGNLATAKTLDRPTELKMVTRQRLWAGGFGAMFDYVIDWAIRAPNGALRGMGRVVVDQRTGRWSIEMAIDPESGDPENNVEPTPYDRHVDIDFPGILDQDIQARVQAVVSAAGTGKLPPKIITQQLLLALGIDDIDEIMEELYPDGGGMEFPEPPPQFQRPGDDDEDADAAADERLGEALRQLTAVVSANGKAALPGEALE